MPFSYPHICAWCGSKMPTSTYTVKYKEEKLVNYFIIGYRKQISNYTFTLPVCSACKEELEYYDKKIYLLTLLGIFLGLLPIIGVSIYIGSFGLWVCPIMPFFWGAGGGVIVRFIAKRMVKVKQWGRVVNGFPDFYNEDFNNAFLELLKTTPPQTNNTMQSSNTGLHF
jgi:hypothetical protein